MLEGQKGRKTCLYNKKDDVLDRFIYFIQRFCFVLFCFTIFCLLASWSLPRQGRVRDGAKALQKLDLDPSRVYFPETSCWWWKVWPRNLKFIRGVWGGRGEAKRPPHPSFRLPLLAGRQPLSFLKAWVSAAVHSWLYLPLEGNGFCFFLGFGVWDLGCVWLPWWLRW